MFVLSCATRDYVWGSRNHIARFTGTQPPDGPQAEMWIGAHGGDPSRLPDGRRLDDAIRNAPEEFLGDRVTEMFGPRLPFLMKALAAAEPLSLQVHPTSERARIGHALEDSKGIPLSSPVRSYQDEFHKPELVFALTRFEGMAGFRDVEKSAQILRLLDMAWADEIAWRLESGPAFQALRSVVTDMLGMTGDPLAELLAELGQAARRAEERGHREDRLIRRPRERTSVSREGTRVFAQTGALVERYPRDPGVLVTLLLNHVVLAAGEAMFLNAGVVHAYTSGFGVEIMASSDNVVRAGLTRKHVDVAELLSITNFTPIPPPLWTPRPSPDGALHLEPPVTEFALSVGVAPLALPHLDGPRVVLVLDGSIEATTDEHSLRISQGQSVFVTHAEGKLTLAGDGRVAVAVVPG